MQFKVVKFFERVGPGFAFSYEPGRVIDAGAMDHERLVRQGFLEVFGEEAVEAKEQKAQAVDVTPTPKPKKMRKAAAI